jgi:hypothetical protein
MIVPAFRVPGRYKLSLRLFNSDEFPRGCVHGYFQFCVSAAGAVDHVPDQIVVHAIPFENVHHGSVSFFGEQLVAAMLLRDFEGFVGIDFQELEVECRGRGIARIVGVLDTGIDPAIVTGTSPCVRFRSALGD